MKKTITFKEAYRFPLEGMCSKVLTKDHTMAFDFPFMQGMWDEENKNEIILDEYDQARVINTINGKNEISFNNLSHKDGFIRSKGRVLLVVRGWGYLTGCGGLNLSPEVAVKIQDDFADFLISRLSSNEQNLERSVATEDQSSNEADNKK